jgi:hypothetical protein
LSFLAAHEPMGADCRGGGGHLAPHLENALTVLLGTPTGWKGCLDAPERVVDEIAGAPDHYPAPLTDALRWSREPRELADHLWVDEPTLRTRMASLDPIEVAEPEHQLEDEWLWLP